MSSRVTHGEGDGEREGERKRENLWNNLRHEAEKRIGGRGGRAEKFTDHPNLSTKPLAWTLDVKTANNFRNEGRKKGREGERWRAEQRGFFTGFSPRFFFSAGARATRPFYKFTPVHRSFSAELSRSNALPARGVGCAFLQAFVPGLSCVCRIHRSFVRSFVRKVL